MGFRLQISHKTIAAAFICSASFQLKEVIYMVTVPAGFPRAITASQALFELFAQHRAATGKPRGAFP